MFIINHAVMAERIKKVYEYQHKNINNHLRHKVIYVMKNRK